MSDYEKYKSDYYGAFTSANNLVPSPLLSAAVSGFSFRQHRVMQGPPSFVKRQSDAPAWQRVPFGRRAARTKDRVARFPRVTARVGRPAFVSAH